MDKLLSRKSMLIAVVTLLYLVAGIYYYFVNGHLTSRYKEVETAADAKSNLVRVLQTKLKEAAAAASPTSSTSPGLAQQAVPTEHSEEDFIRSLSQIAAEAKVTATKVTFSDVFAAAAVESSPGTAAAAPTPSSAPADPQGAAAASPSPSAQDLPAGVNSLEITLELTGTYGTLVDFTDRLYKQPRFVHAKMMDVKAGSEPGQYLATMSVMAYYLK